MYETQFGEKAITNQFSYYYHYTPVDTSQAHYKLPGKNIYFNIFFFLRNSKNINQFII